jgi:hypothetical protein
VTIEKTTRWYARETNSTSAFDVCSGAMARLLRIADGPDEVHRNLIARIEQKRHQAVDPRTTGGTVEAVRSGNLMELGIWNAAEHGRQASARAAS